VSGHIRSIRLARSRHDELYNFTKNGK
jgi:hypothetical protein